MRFLFITFLLVSFQTLADVGLKSAPEWQLELYRGFTPYCKASLISPQWAITAAHCVYDPMSKQTLPFSSPFYLQNIRLRRLPLDGKRNVRIDSIFIHPDYDYDRKFADIALIKIKNSETLRSIKFPSINIYSALDYFETLRTTVWFKKDSKHRAFHYSLPVKIKKERAFTLSADSEIPLCKEVKLEMTNQVSHLGANSGSPLYAKAQDGRIALIALHRSSVGCDKNYTFTRLKPFYRFIKDKLEQFTD